MNVLYSVL